jgi:mRNA interferase MazF
VTATALYVPDVGHIVWLSLNPRRGHEQAGRRPFLVLSPRAYNEKTSLAVGVPVTSVAKGNPFEVPLAARGRVAGVVLADQVKNLDWRARRAEYADDVQLSTLRSVRALIATLLGLR